MVLTFYPSSDDVQKGTIEDRLEIFMDAAERYKAIVFDAKQESTDEKKRMIPRDMVAAYNWEEIANILHEIREYPEATKPEKIKKSELLMKLAEVYEVLRAAKMSKLEAVRLALISEANQLRGGAQVT